MPPAMPPAMGGGFGGGGGAARPSVEELPCATCMACPCTCGPPASGPAESDPGYSAWRNVMEHLSSGSRMNLQNNGPQAEANPMYRQSVEGVCVPFNRGFCRKGESCKYDHRYTPGAMEVAAYSEPSTIRREDLNRAARPKKLKPCFDLLRKGACARGANCPFSHEDPAKLKDEHKPPCFAFQQMTLPP